MAVYASILAEDLRLDSAQSDGPRLLRTFLHFAQTGHLDLPGGHADALPENPFEAGVRGELGRLGHEVVSQVGVAGFRIDLAVMDPKRPGRFLCGIECDGASYHSSPAARDRDRLRQQLLEARGWTILRVWSTDWFKDRSGEVARLDARLRELARQVQPIPEAESADSAAAESVVAAPEPTTTAPVTALVGTEARERPYRRPVLTPYVAVVELTPAPGGELTEAPLDLLARHLRQIAAVEAPIHVDELAARLVAVWQRRQGSRIRTHLDRALAVLLREGGLVRRGDFIHREEGRVVARRRTDVALKADRIAPEEYGAALLAVLADGHGFDRNRLLGEVRGVLGFSRTGPQLESAIEAAVQDLLAKGVLGQGSAGVALRDGQGGESGLRVNVLP
jgi:very-short-patch-repair endonuclease